MHTILGAGGFLGKALVQRLRAEGIPHVAVGRHDTLPTGPLGQVVFAIGVTADFRARPLDAMDAHVTELVRLLREDRFESLLYLSSTRVYSGSDATDEDQPLKIVPSNPSDLYNASKVAGEAACLAYAGLGVTRVVRLSNVYGGDIDSENFLSEVVKSAIRTKTVELRTSLSSDKDYVSIGAAVQSLLAISATGRHRLYNVASGRNVTNAQIAERLSECTGCAVTVSPNAPAVRFPPIDVSRLTAEFGKLQCDVLEDMREIVSMFRAERKAV